MPPKAQDSSLPLAPEACFEALGTTPEQGEKLRIYVDLLQKWQAKINLVSASTLDDVWRRHILDSGQLKAHIPTSDLEVADLGSGAGFPGLVLAILGVGPVTLIESDQRKGAFMREVARATEAPATVLTQRIEKTQRLEFDLITSRALAPLETLLAWSIPLLKDSGMLLFLKGRRADEELTMARKAWMMTEIRHPSLTAPDATLLEIRDLIPRT